MNCPRCGARLVRYSFGTQDAVVCEPCGYVGVDVEHESERVEMESWDDALRRFREDT